MTELTGKRVLITGSKGGIGFAIAKKFAEAGAELVLHARNESPEFIEAKTKLSKLSMADISGVFGDFSNQDACKQIFETLMKDQKTVDVLVNNAATQTLSALTDMSGTKVREMLEINLQAPILMTRYFAEQAQGGGSIVNICSIEALTPALNHSHYAASKACLLYTSPSPRDATLSRMPSSA